MNHASTLSVPKALLPAILVLGALADLTGLAQPAQAQVPPLNVAGGVMPVADQILLTFDQGVLVYAETFGVSLEEAAQ